MNNKKEKIIIKPEYSAVAAKNPNKPSRAVKAAIFAFKELKVSSVAEIGCGLLANSPHILQAFPSVVLVDTKYQYVRIKEKLDKISKIYPSFRRFIDSETFQNKKMRLEGAIMINVLHVLPTVEERIKLLEETYQNLKEGGFLFVDVPRNETYYRKKLKTAKSYNDGHIMGRSKYYTFYKNMSFEEIRNYTEKVGFRFIQRIYLDHRVTFTCRR